MKKRANSADSIKFMHPGARYKQYQIGKFTSSNVEAKDLLKAWIAVSLAIGIVLSKVPSFELSFLQAIIISLVVVGTGFLLHELGHKIVAQKYKYFAEFRSFDEMLFLAIILSFFGFVFAAPGAVMIGGRGIKDSHNGKISAAGPFVNIILGLLFLVLMYTTSGFASTVGFWGARINAWLALFNLIPVWVFDGAKIFRWNKGVWLLLLGGGLALLFQNGIIGTLLG